MIRLTVGLIFLSEGIQKFMYPEILGSGRFAKLGIDPPAFWAGFTGAFEIICSLLIVIGLFTRLAVMPLLVIMIVAFKTTKWPELIDQGFWPMLDDGRTDFAMMQTEVVEKRKWMDHQHFMDLIGATNLIPGPNSTEMAIHIGHEKAGWKGLVVAGCCFILPAVIITGVSAWLYRSYGQFPPVRPFTYGIKPAIIAIILAAVFPLAKNSLKTTELGVIGVLAFIGSLAGLNEIAVMFGSGFVIIFLYTIRNSRRGLKSFMPFLFLNIPFLSQENMKIFWIFLKIGAILYGSGYVLFAFLDSELVAKGMLTRTQLVDAIAVGQFTPGPVFSSVTFIGWQMNGMQGAAVATIGVFLPSFVFVALLNPLVPRMRKSRLFSAFLDGVNIASVAIILTVCISFARETISDWRTIVIALLSLVLTFGFRKINTVFLVVGSAALGYALHLI